MPRRRPPECALQILVLEETVKRGPSKPEENIGSIILIVEARPTAFPEMRSNKKEY
jgi:hypothetical protein